MTPSLVRSSPAHVSLFGLTVDLGYKTAGSLQMLTRYSLSSICINNTFDFPLVLFVNSFKMKTFAILTSLAATALAQNVFVNLPKGPTLEAGSEAIIQVTRPVHIP
jgi:hypothetical protein